MPEPPVGQPCELRGGGSGDRAGGTPGADEVPCPRCCFGASTVHNNQIKETGLRITCLARLCLHAGHTNQGEVAFGVRVGLLVTRTSPQGTLPAPGSRRQLPRAGTVTPRELGSGKWSGTGRSVSWARARGVWAPSHTDTPRPDVFQSILVAPLLVAPSLAAVPRSAPPRTTTKPQPRVLTPQPHFDRAPRDTTECFWQDAGPARGSVLRRSCAGSASAAAAPGREMNFLSPRQEQPRGHRSGCPALREAAIREPNTWCFHF